MMQEILDSIGNGQRRQAVRQIVTSTFTFREVFDELESIGLCNEVLIMFTIAQNMDYIKVKGE